jgi:hypothetical protein
MNFCQNNKCLFKSKWTCSGCDLNISYCSKECQKTDWSRHSCFCLKMNNLLIGGKHKRPDIEDLPDDNEIFTSEHFKNLNPNDLILFQKEHYFYLPGLYNWVFNEHNLKNPLTRQDITLVDLLYIKEIANERFPMRVDVFKKNSNISTAIIQTTTLISRLELLSLIFKTYYNDNMIKLESIFDAFQKLVVLNKIKFVIDGEDDYEFINRNVGFKGDVIRVDVEKKLKLEDKIKRISEMMEISRNLYETKFPEFEHFDVMFRSFQKYLEKYELEENDKKKTIIRIELTQSEDVFTRRVLPKDIYKIFQELFKDFYKPLSGYGFWRNVFSVIQGNIYVSKPVQIENNDEFPYMEKDFRKFLKDPEIIISIYDWYNPPEIIIDLIIKDEQYEPFLIDPEELLNVLEDDEQMKEYARNIIGDNLDNWINSSFIITENWTGDNEVREGFLNEKNPILDVLEILKKYQDDFEKFCPVPEYSKSEKVIWKFELNIK